MILPINAGKYRHRITIEQREITKNAVGEKTETWTRQYDVWCDIEQSGISDAIENSRISQTGSYSIKLRYRSDLTYENRVNYDGAILEIQELMTDPLKIEITLICINRRENE